MLTQVLTLDVAVETFVSASVGFALDLGVICKSLFASIPNRGYVCSHLIPCPPILSLLTPISFIQEQQSQTNCFSCVCVSLCLCLCVCVSVSLSLCVHLHCLLHLQGLDGAKGDKVSLPFCLVEEIRRGFGYKGEEQMVIARDCFESHNPHSHPPSHSHTRTHASSHTHSHLPAGTHRETSEVTSVALLPDWRSFWGSERNEGEGLLITVFIRVPASNFHWQGGREEEEEEGPGAYCSKKKKKSHSAYSFAVFEGS